MNGRFLLELLGAMADNVKPRLRDGAKDGNAQEVLSLLMGNSLAMWADFTALPEGDLEIDMRALPAHANLDNMMHFTREVKKVL